MDNSASSVISCGHTIMQQNGKKTLVKYILICWCLQIFQVSEIVKAQLMSNISQATTESPSMRSMEERVECNDLLWTKKNITLK